MGRALNDVALRRGQSLAQMAVAWLLSRQAMTSVIVGPRTVEQLADNLQALRGTDFSEEELAEIDHILSAQ